MVIVLGGLAGCRAAQGPAGFWTEYQHDLVATTSSDQGPWGGERSMTWRAPATGMFSFDHARAFAERHGWKLLSTSHVDIPRGSATPGTHEPAYLAMPSTIGQFDSGWTREDPGTSATRPAIGYVQVSDDGRDMYVYHFWGNG